MKAYGFDVPPIPVGPPVLGQTPADSDHDHVTTVHVHEDADIPEDLTLDSLEVDDLQVLDGLVVAGTLTAALVDVTDIEAKDVVFDNLVVNGRAADYSAAPIPGLWSNVSTVTDQLNMTNDAVLIIKHSDPATTNCIEHFNDPDDSVADWVLDGDGKLSSYDAQLNALETDVALLADSNEDGAFIGDAESIYVGRAKFGFNKALDKLTLKLLVPNHIPGKLAADGFTSGDLGGFTFAEMTVKRWRNRARVFYDDDTTKVKDVFDLAYKNEDWENRDAPGVETVAADVATLDASMTQAETDIDASEVAVAAINTKLGSVTQAQFGHLVGVTSNIQAQLDASSGLGSNAVIENTDDHASLQILTTTGSTHSASIEIEVDALNDLLDHKYSISSGTGNSNDWQFRSQQADDSWVTAFRIAPTGQLIFGQATSYNLADFRVKGTAYFDAQVTANNLVVGGTDVGTALANIPSPVMVRNTVHMTGNWTTWPVLPNDLSVLVHDTNSTSRYQLPIGTVADGYRFKVMACAGSGLGTIHLSCGVVSGRQIHANSTGAVNNIQVTFNSVGTGSWDVCYISATNMWLVV